MINILRAIFSPGPGDFPWEDVFPPLLTEWAYAYSRLIEGTMGGNWFGFWFVVWLCCLLIASWFLVRKDVMR